MTPEVHLFVLWENARVEEERILSDIRARFEVLAEVEAEWPKDIGAEQGFRRFYGTFLADAAGKARRAGEGRFLIVVVRDNAPVYKMVETARGLEKVDVNIFSQKYVYRDWVGGQHRVHGTNSPEEARRDVMLLTGRPLAEWVSGGAVGKPMTVLPGQRGWSSMAEMFAFLDETLPYVVLRNGENLPERFDFVHDDVDMLVSDASDAVGLLGARKVKGGGALYEVTVAGRAVKLDLRAVGDDYYDEGWERRMLLRRVRNPGGVYVLAPDDGFFALVYHAVFQKKSIAPDYPSKAAGLARAADVQGRGFDDWVRELDRFMSVNGYGCPRPKDRTVSFNGQLLSWREKAVEASMLFGFDQVRLSNLVDRTFRVDKLTDLILSTEKEGRALQIEYGKHLKGLGTGEYHAARAFYEAVPDLTVEPVTWHVGRSGAYLVYDGVPGETLASRLIYGSALTDAEADDIAEAILKMAHVLVEIGYVHRDVRPENLLLVAGGGVRLIGFRFALERKSYRKECSTLRKDPLNRLARLGGDFAAEPGVWNDAVSFVRCLEKLPATGKVQAAIAELKALGSRTGSLHVRLPANVRVRLFFVWLKLALSDLLRPHSRAAAKHAVRRRFAWNAARG